MLGLRRCQEEPEKPRLAKKYSRSETLGSEHWGAYISSMVVLGTLYKPKVRQLSQRGNKVDTYVAPSTLR